MTEKIQQIVDAIGELKILELSELVSALEEKYGVVAVSVGGAGGGDAGNAAPVVEEKTEFDVELTEFAEDKKLKVIKIVKDLTGLSLGEAKEIVLSAPKVVKAGVSKEEAEDLKKQIEEVGGTVTIK